MAKQKKSQKEKENSDGLIAGLMILVHHTRDDKLHRILMNSEDADAALFAAVEKHKTIRISEETYTVTEDRPDEEV